MTTEATPFIPGKAQIFWESKKPVVVIFGTGPILYNALEAARALEKEKIGSIVVNVHTLKPLDEKMIVALAKTCGAVIAVEEHSVIGGLGGAISEVLAREAPTLMEFIGMQNRFGESGKPNELLEKYGMSANDIVRAAKRVLKKKGT